VVKDENPEKLPKKLQRKVPVNEHWAPKN
jgi:hypothetical protein